MEPVTASYEAVTAERPAGVDTPPAVRTFYACRRCRTPLFTAEEVLSHDPRQGFNKNFRHRRSGAAQEEVVLGAPSTFTNASLEGCTSLFLDPDQSPWIAEDMRRAHTDGTVVEPDTIYCRNPRCPAKLGTQSWTGVQCSCGAWITPAFRIHSRAVDKMQDDQRTSSRPTLPLSPLLFSAAQP